jgi:hypothetical protein
MEDSRISSCLPRCRRARRRRGRRRAGRSEWGKKESRENNREARRNCLDCGGHDPHKSGGLLKERASDFPYFSGFIFSPLPQVESRRYGLYQGFFIKKLYQFTLNEADYSSQPGAIPFEARSTRIILSLARTRKLAGQVPAILSGSRRSIVGVTTSARTARVDIENRLL